MRNNITISLYRYSKIFKPNSEFRTFEKKIWPQSSDYEHIQVNWDKYATYNNKIDNVIINPYNDLKKTFWDKFSNSKIDSPNNLIYNGNFDYGLKFWDTIAPDSIGHKIIHTKYGNAIRISRGKGTGYWSLIYNGRNIYFYEDVEYILHFKFRVITGSGIPFYVGFRLNEGNGYIYNLPKTVTEISNGWHQYTVKYKFKASHENLIFFLNSQKPNTVIDITDIILTSNDDLDRHPYRNQVLKIHGTNLLYNSNFENGLKFWSSFSPDSIGHELIETEHGTAVRINRGNGKGFWQLTYEGRDIFYHKGLTYYFRFKYRVINGSSIPFYIGWWYKDNDEYVNNVPKRIYPLGNDWYECITKYTFKENHFNRTKLFLNTLDPNTTIDVTDIELICTDSLTSKLYADENTNLISKSEEQEVKEIINEENDPFLSSRIKRWDFALTYFQNYKWHEKFIGGGFDYLETFGKKFFPDQGRKDYPHNPIISSFLYSGITGGVAYIYYLMLSFIYYWRYRKKIGIFLILYSVIFIFIFLSSDSHFNTPIFAFLSLIPFIARYNIYQRENRNQHK